MTANGKEFTVHCPHCQHELPKEFVMRAHGTLSAAMRTTHRGPERVIYRCGCGELFSAREIREHSCPQKPSRGKEERATDEERALYHARKKESEAVAVPIASLAASAAAEPGA